nr:hypothetical protein [uncultured bacterium]
MSRPLLFTVKRQPHLTSLCHDERQCAVQRFFSSEPDLLRPS